MLDESQVKLITKIWREKLLKVAMKQHPLPHDYKFKGSQHKNKITGYHLSNGYDMEYMLNEIINLCQNKEVYITGIVGAQGGDKLIFSTIFKYHGIERV